MNHSEVINNTSASNCTQDNTFFKDAYLGQRILDISWHFPPVKKIGKGA